MITFARIMYIFVVVIIYCCCNHILFIQSLIAGDIIIEKLSGVQHVVEINDPFLALVSVSAIDHATISNSNKPTP